MSTSPPEFGGCLWPVDSACFGDDWDALPEHVKARSLALASATLERLTAGRVKACPVTVRPCSPRCGRGLAFTGRGWEPYIDSGGQWVNGCGCVTLDCGCTGSAEVTLAPPVGRVVEVKIDGAVVPPTAYRVDDGFRLVRTDGEQWPTTQDVVLPDTEVGTFSVTYVNGYPPDSMAAYAAGVLAYEFARACTGSGKCRLPAGVTSIVRQGVSLQVVTGSFPDGNTGLREVDAFVALWNPRHMAQESQVIVPGARRHRVQGAS